MYIWRIIELMWNIKRVQEKVCMKAIIFRRCQYLYSIFCLVSSGVRSGLVRFYNQVGWGTWLGQVSLKASQKLNVHISGFPLGPNKSLPTDIGTLRFLCSYQRHLFFNVTAILFLNKTSCTSVKTCSLFSTGRGSTLRTPCRWRFSSSLLAREHRQKIIGCMFDFGGDYMSLFCTHPKSCLLCV